jgi:polyhydroxybutyrate depolymerase
MRLPSLLLLPLVLLPAALLPLAACSSSDAKPTDATPNAAPASALLDDASAPEPSPDAATSKAPSKGCGIAPADAGAVTKTTILAASKTRTYHLSVPAGLPKGQLAPLVFVLHGASDTAPENMRDWFAVEAEMPGALFVYPQALPRTRADGTGGNVPRWDLDGNEDLAFFDAMLGAISDGYCVDRAQVFVTGFSSGGNFSQQLACLRQKDVKGMAVVAGPGPFSDPCGGAVPVWMTHDVKDDTLPIADARSSRDFWAAEDGCATSTWTAVAGQPECRRNTSCSKGSLVYCETTGVGHAVPPFAAASIGAFFGQLSK